LFSDLYWHLLSHTGCNIKNGHYDSEVIPQANLKNDAGNKIILKKLLTEIGSDLHSLPRIHWAVVHFL
jgi:hypothetical protein